MVEQTKKKQIVVFGGCFNPPLNSHFLLAQQLINEYDKIEKIIFVPVNSKYQKVDLISNEHRYQMLKLVCDQNEKFEVSRIEIDSPRQLYTIETLLSLQEKYRNYEVAFLLGSDNLKELSTWQRPEELIKKFSIYVNKRAEDDIEEIIASDNFLKRNQNQLVLSKNEIKTNLSSSFVRRKIKEGKSIKYLAPEEVILYITKHQLYN